MQRELESFLGSLPVPKVIGATAPPDILRFLVWKDRKGKTQVHDKSCPFIGNGGKSPCECPTRLAAGTVDSTIGKLRSIFHALGRSSDWDELTLSGNPVTHHSVKSYLKSVRWEQAQARTPCRQATPLFWDKFLKVVQHIRSTLEKTDTTPLEKYILARDLAFFTVAFSSGGRTGDLGRLRTIDLIGKPGDQHWFIHQRVGKTLRGKNTRVIPILPMSNPVVCPVANVRYYGDVCRALGIRLGTGYLFRPTSANGGVRNEPFLYQAAYERLRLYLSSLDIFDGETPHSFRNGAAIMLRLLGASKEQVASHLGWQSSRMVEHYTQLEKILGLPGEAGSSGISRLDSSEILDKLCSEFQDRNMLSGYSPVFLDPV